MMTQTLTDYSHYKESTVEEFFTAEAKKDDDPIAWPPIKKATPHKRKPYAKHTAEAVDERYAGIYRQLMAGKKITIKWIMHTFSLSLSTAKSVYYKIPLKMLALYGLDISRKDGGYELPKG